MAAQGLSALMEDSRPCSLVFCHAHGAQIPEFLHGCSPGASEERLRVGMRKPERLLTLRLCSFAAEQGRFPPCFSIVARKHFSFDSHRPVQD
jgi:hypothetical protein